MPELDRGATLMTLFEARRYDLASKSDRKLMASIINEALKVTETAERERCARIADPWPGFPTNEPNAYDAKITPSDNAVIEVRQKIAAAIRGEPR